MKYNSKWNTKGNCTAPYKAIKPSLLNKVGTLLTLKSWSKLCKKNSNIGNILKSFLEIIPHKIRAVTNRNFHGVITIEEFRR